MRPRIHTLKRVVLFLGDLVVFELALVPTLFLRYGILSSIDWYRHAVPFGLVSFIWCINFYIANIYQIDPTAEPLRLLRTYLETMAINLGVSIGFFYLIPVFGIAPRTNLFVHFLISLFFGYAWHLFFQWVTRRPDTSPVLYIGPKEELVPLEYLLRQNPYGYQLNYAYCPFTSQCSSQTLPVSRTIKIINTPVELSTIVEHESIDIIILDENYPIDPSLKEVLHHLIFRGVTFLDRAEIEEVIAHRVPVSHISQTWLLHHLNEPRKDIYEHVKRAFDLFLTIPFGILTLLFIPIVALGTTLNSRGPVFYQQTRVGKNGRLFRLWKFRTMQLDAEAGGPQFTAATKTDPRITRFGRILRQLRIDELPQIWNVIKGDLSFIGPRPERPEFVQPLLAQEPFYGLRHLTRPGLTGWAQVTFLKPNASLEDNVVKLQYDLYYIKHRSFILDLAILLKTVRIVLARQGT